MTTKYFARLVHERQELPSPCDSEGRLGVGVVSVERSSGRQRSDARLSASDATATRHSNRQRHDGQKPSKCPCNTLQSASFIHNNMHLPMVTIDCNVSLQLLVGARINELASHKRTCLHVAAEQDQATICQILIDNKINFDALDDSLNNGLQRSMSIPTATLSTLTK